MKLKIVDMFTLRMQIPEVAKLNMTSKEQETE